MACAVRAREPASVFPGLAALCGDSEPAVLDVPVSVRVEASVVEVATVKVGGQVSTADEGSVQIRAADTGPVMRRRMNVIARAVVWRLCNFRNCLQLWPSWTL